MRLVLKMQFPLPSDLTVPVYRCVVILITPIDRPTRDGPSLNGPRKDSSRRGRSLGSLLCLRGLDIPVTGWRSGTINEPLLGDVLLVQRIALDRDAQ